MTIRPRRLRTTARMREAVAETRVVPQRLVQPHFVMDGDGADVPIESMPGVARMSIPRLVERVKADHASGVGNVLLFGVTEQKDAQASAATDPDGLIPRAVRALRDALGDDLLLITDVCLCGATDHGHCGVLSDGVVQNDDSLPLLADAALAHARAGADVVAPSDMMDHRVSAIRDRLEDEGFVDTAILSYSTKFASAFYGPFRDAASSAPQAGDRKSYQMDPRNRREALRESLLDEEEGADMLMVKPALSYLDVISDIAEDALVPLAAYNVSGEYSMVKAAAERGWVDEGRVVAEILGSIARAGADLIISYHTRDAVEKGWLR
jgi:porphobilinogen synthase